MGRMERYGLAKGEYMRDGGGSERTYHDVMGVTCDCLDSA